MSHSINFILFAMMVPAFLILIFLITPYLLGFLLVAAPLWGPAGASSGLITAASAVDLGIGGLIIDAAGYVRLGWAAAAFFLLLRRLLAMAVPLSRIATAGPTLV